MTKLGNLVARTDLAQRVARGAALAGLGLALLTGGICLAAEKGVATDAERAAERGAARAGGEAEAAPAEDVKELAAGRLFVAQPEREAGVNSARVVAHTAQLPRASGKPTLSVELPKPPPPPVPTARAASTPAQPAAGPGTSRPAPASRSGVAATKAGAVGPARRTHLPLAPSAAEIGREIAARNGGPLSGGASSPGASGAAKDKPSAGARLQERATTAPTQNPRWPTHVDYSAGPSGPAGGNTAGDRKGALIEATGPQQGVIRNRW